jgi:lipopolysaccharide transport system permease protein
MALIAPARSRVRIPELWTSMPLARTLAVRDFKVRYKQSALGWLWLLIQPLGMLAAFTAVFGGVADVGTDGVPYALFALVGVTVWTFVSSAVATGVRAHVMNLKLIKLVPCPRVAFVTANLIATLPYLAVPLLLTLVAIPLAGRALPVQTFALPLVALWLCVLVFAWTLLLSAVNVRFRDVAQTIPFLLQSGVFLTPIAYPLSEAGSGLQTLLALNPLAGLLEVWRWCLLGTPPDELALMVSAASTPIVLAAAWYLFSRLEPRFADVV